MKRIIYAVLFVVSSALVFTSCTEEEVTPNTVFNGGGNIDETIKK